MISYKKGDILENILITDLVQSQTMARIDSLVVFIEGGVPGDLVDLQIFGFKKNYIEAKVIRIHQPSLDRLQAFCSHFGICGGCKWQHLTYEKQIFYKQKHVEETLVRIGKLDLPEISPIIGSAKTQYYRNKLDFAFSNKRWLTPEEMNHGIPDSDNAIGFHVPRRFDKVIDIQKCYLQDDLSNRIRLEIKAFAIEHNISFFDVREQQGSLRNLIIRSTSTGEWMVILVFHKDVPQERSLLLDHLAEQFHEITSLQFVINPKLNDTIFDLPVILFKGRNHILEEMEGLKFKISAKSFYQTNSYQAYELYKIVREFAQLTGSETVYDLYTGTGTIANFISNKAGKVIGIDNVNDAIEDAAENARLNNIHNTQFFAGDMRKTLMNEFISTHGKPGVIITDPPRAGMHADVVHKMAETKAERIVYVSCNPSTQARDLQLLNEHYEIVSVQPVDMFPHTVHVENVVLLKLR